MVRTIFLGLFAAFLGAYPLASRAAGLADLASYRAVHKLSLARAESSSGIIDIRGRLVIEWVDVCTGYTLEQRMVMETTDQEGNVSLSDFGFSTWESRDGKAIRFNLLHEVDGRAIDEVVGRADIDADGGGRVRLEKPQVVEFDLPKGTLFSTQHTARLIRKAQAGERSDTAMIYDGSGVDGLFRAVARFGDEIPPAKTEAVVRKAYGNLPSWPTRIVFFPPDATDGLPDYEMSIRMYANGVAGDIQLDYQSFSIKGELEQLEPLTGGC